MILARRLLHFAEREGVSARKTGVVLAIAGAAMASMKAVLVKLAYAAAAVSPVALLNLRMLLALPFFLWLFLHDRHAPPLRRKHWLMLAGLGFAGYYFSSFADFTGLQYVSAGLERLILFTYPSLVVLIEWLWRGKPLRRPTLIAMLISYCGLAIAFSHDLSFGETEAILIGSAWILAAALSFAIYYVGASALISEIGTSRFAGGVGLFATAMVVTHGLLSEPLTAYAELPSTVWWSALAMALVCTVLTSWLNAKAISLIGASETAAIGNLGPVLTIAAGWLVLAEPFSLAQVAGMLLVVLGVRRLSS